MSKEIKTITVNGMSCSHCENAVKKSAGALAGVENVTVDLKGGKVTVEYNSDKVTLKQIGDAIEDQGYDVVYE